MNGFYHCPHCESYFDPDDFCSDACPYCEDTGTIDCFDKERSYDFCERCGNKCYRHSELEDEHECVCAEYRYEL